MNEALPTIIIVAVSCLLLGFAGGVFLIDKLTKARQGWPRAKWKPGTDTDPAMANEIAHIVIDVFGGGYVPLDVRYGIADAVLRAGYTKPKDSDA